MKPLILAVRAITFSLPRATINTPTPQERAQLQQALQDGLETCTPSIMRANEALRGRLDELKRLLD